MNRNTHLHKRYDILLFDKRLIYRLIVMSLRRCRLTNDTICCFHRNHLLKQYTFYFDIHSYSVAQLFFLYDVQADLKSFQCT